MIVSSLGSEPQGAEVGLEGEPARHAMLGDYANQMCLEMVNAGSMVFNQSTLA